MARGGTNKVEQALDELRQTPPREFTKKRNALAAAMANEGLKKEASAVRAARKPAASVWAIGALARNDRDKVAAVLNAGAAVRREQRGAVIGAGPGTLREATRQFHAAVSAATQAADALLREAGERPSPSVMARIRQTLLASAEAPEEARTAIREGALDVELSPMGFGDVGAISRASEPSDRRETQPQTIVETERESAPKVRELREERQRRHVLLRRELEQRERDLRAASGEERRLERIAEALEERAREARERANLARGKTEQARRARDEVQQKIAAAESPPRS
jgi:hypothetical protein